MLNSHLCSIFEHLEAKLLQILKTFKGLREQLESGQGTVGFVPTMGALHEGHLSLVRRAASENARVVVSIFVNPTQFNDPEDLEKYPRNLEKDLKILEPLSSKLFVVCPEVSELYGDRLESKTYDLAHLSEVMEGAMRPGHYQGVATVVEKLIKAVGPDQAYFGEKDFQQFKVIERLVALESLNVRLVQCPIAREDNGLARSSRNELLSPQARTDAGIIYEVLERIKKDYQSRDYSYQFLKSKGISELSKIPNSKVEYFILADEDSLAEIETSVHPNKVRAFVAIQLEKIRLIDTLNYQE